MDENLNRDDLLAKAQQPAADAMRLHPFYRGKIETSLKCCVRDISDFAIWYTPGVAAPCQAIVANPELVDTYTNRGNTVAVVSDGTRVLGLGDIGPKAGLPVMEGKALLFKYLGGVDAFPIMLDTKDPDKLIDTVLMMQPSFGGINLEDIAQPKCYKILDKLREQSEIPVWHDDQQGTATVILAGLLNALKLTGRRIGDARVVFVGSGAANSAAARLIFARGADPGRCILVDIEGTLGAFRSDIEADKLEQYVLWNLCKKTNAAGRRGGVAEALQGADVVIAASRPGPGTIKPEWIRTMAPDAIVFACANPVPEIWPWEAKAAGAVVVATGRSDFPNQVNNSLGFPGIFRGTLDVKATTITDEMCFAAADALAGHNAEQMDAEHLLPPMDDWWVYAEEAVAVGMKAQEQGIARLNKTKEELYASACTAIQRSRSMTQQLMKTGFIPEAPEPNQ